MSYFLGCDVAKRKIDVALVDAMGIPQWHDVVPNTHADLAAYLLTLQGAYPDDEIVCVVEATGAYHYPLLDACEEAGLACRLFNPVMTKQQIRATVRGTKTDKTDAVAIARIGMQGGGRLATPEAYAAAKSLVRSMQKLKELDHALTLHRRHLVEGSREPVPEAATLAIQGIQVALDAAYKQLYKDLLQTTAGELLRLLQTVPGVGPYVAASLVAELQDVRRFARGNQLVAYVGLDLKVAQSGDSLNHTGHLTKRGSSYLRRNLFLAANIARQHDPYFRSVYDKKRGEGKTYTTAVLAVARKLVLVVRAVWISGKPYDPLAMTGGVEKFALGTGA
jgi:transposase